MLKYSVGASSFWTPQSLKTQNSLTTPTLDILLACFSYLFWTIFLKSINSRKCCQNPSILAISIRRLGRG